MYYLIVGLFPINNEDAILDEGPRLFMRISSCNKYVIKVCSVIFSCPLKTTKNVLYLVTCSSLLISHYLHYWHVILLLTTIPTRIEMYEYVLSCFHSPSFSCKYIFVMKHFAFQIIWSIHPKFRLMCYKRFHETLDSF